MSANLDRCPRCSSELQPGTRYCSNCGFDTSSPTQAAPAAPGVPGAAPGWQGSADAKQRAMESVQRRGQTDEMIPEYWVAFPIIAVLLTFGIGMAVLFINPVASLPVFIGGSVIATILVAFLIYKLLKRRNEHMMREAALRRSLIDYFKMRGEEKGAGYQTFQYVQTMEAIDRDAVINEKPQDPILWTVLCIIPLVNIVAIPLTLYWLTEFASNHDRRFFAFAQNVQLAGSQVGMANMMPPLWRPVRDRSFVLYLIVTILFSIFAVYWFYVLIKDMNEHFKNEWEFEDALTREIQSS